MHYKAIGLTILAKYKKFNEAISILCDIENKSRYNKGSTRKIKILKPWVSILFILFLFIIYKRSFILLFFFLQRLISKVLSRRVRCLRQNELKNDKSTKLYENVSIIEGKKNNYGDKNDSKLSCKK